jgi:N-carbamoylputrescine amidase
MVLVVPFFEKQDRGVYYNSLLVTDTQGGHYGLYRKMHIPDDPGFNEKYYFIPGDLGYKVFETPYGKIGTLICWDQWFPEAARLTALMGCDLLVYPTAIGWDEKEWQGLNPGEVEKLKESQKNAWHMMQRSHAIANGVFVAGINRVGVEGHLHFWGNSFICAPSGEFLASADATSETLIHAECSSQEISEHRHLWPFLRDRRTDSYGGLLSKYIGNKT